MAAGSNACSVLGLSALRSTIESRLCAPNRPRASGHVPIAPPLEGTWLYDSDALHLLQPLPGQAQDQGIELLLSENERRGRAIDRPLESPQVEAARSAPDAKDIVHAQLHASATGFG